MVQDTKYISVDIGHRILDPGKCCLCGTQLENALLDYTLDNEKDVIKSEKPIPGYRCPGCEAEYYDTDIAHILDIASLDVLPPESDLVKALQERIAIYNRFVKK
jgi:hypothetical protein